MSLQFLFKCFENILKKLGSGDWETMMLTKVDVLINRIPLASSIQWATDRPNDLYIPWRVTLKELASGEPQNHDVG